MSPLSKSQIWVFKIYRWYQTSELCYNRSLRINCPLSCQNLEMQYIIHGTQNTKGISWS